MIYLTEKAKSKIVQLSSSEEIGHYSLRFKLRGGGCSGLSYDLDFDNISNDTDHIFQFDQIRILIDEVSFQYLNETTIDYVDKLLFSGFKFSNDKVKTSCGCGHSIDFK